MPDFLEEKRNEIHARLKELKPLVEEYSRLAAAASALDRVGAGPARRSGSTSSATPSSGRRGGPRRSKNTSSPAKSTATSAAKGKPKAGRRKGSGARAAQVLALVKKQPGVKIPELAMRMGTEQSYLYRVLPALADTGKVIKGKDRGWHPAGAALEPAERAAIEEKIRLEDKHIQEKRARLAAGVGPKERAEIERDISASEGMVEFWVNQIRQSE
jgi:hypothetical protein